MPEKTPTVTYAYWGAECRTEGCRNTRIIKFRGTRINGEPELPTILPKKIIVTCSICSKSYEYEPAGISPVYKLTPEIGFVDLF
jgi:hypothetical protein